MRIVHTSDWHAGRVWYGQKRLDELHAVLDHLARFVETESVDLLLMSGDVFDNGVPSAQAERLVFRFFKHLGAAGIPSVVIAGNHDSPRRLEAWGILAELVNCRMVARPTAPERGGVVEITTRTGETAKIAAIPFASVRTFVSALELARSDQEAFQSYAGWMRHLLDESAQHFRPDTVNLVMAHAMMENAILARSERRAHVGEQWAVAAQALPSTAQYVALGHIHKPQQLEGAPWAHYAGSPLQLDFGEAGESKSFVVIDVSPGTPARIERVPYEGGKELLDLRASLVELEAEAERLKKAGWLRVTVPLDFPEPEINSRVRRLLPNALSVRVELPPSDHEEDNDQPPPNATAAELFSTFYRRKYERAPEAALVQLFESLHRECGGSGQEAEEG